MGRHVQRRRAANHRLPALIKSLRPNRPASFQYQHVHLLRADDLPSKLGPRQLVLQRMAKNKETANVQKLYEGSPACFHNRIVTLGLESAGNIPFDYRSTYMHTNCVHIARFVSL